MAELDIYNRVKSGEIKVNNRSTLEVRFWAGVDKDGPMHPVCGQCWTWMRSGQRYGKLSLGDVLVSAHRVSWQLHNGVIPENLWVLHHCDNKRCVRPDHLFLGTAADNSRDAVCKGRTVRGSRNVNVKLTEAQARDVKTRYRPRDKRNGGRALAREFGVSPSAIYNLLHEIAWAYVQTCAPVTLAAHGRNLNIDRLRGVA